MVEKMARLFLVGVLAASALGTTSPMMTQGQREKVFDDIRARHHRKAPVCQPPEHPPDNTHPMPVAPHSFSTKVEIAFQETNKMKVIYGSESFDGVLNSGVLKYELMEGIILGRPQDREETIHYSVPLDEALFVVTNEACEDEGGENCDKKKRCHAGVLTDLSAELQELFGYGDVNGAGGYFGAGGILQWGPQYKYEYQGPAECRGMQCEKYWTCVHKPDNKDATLSITYYWSSPSWNVSFADQVPVAIEIYGTEKFGVIFTREVLQRYDFYDFYRDIRPDPDALEPPADVHCKDRNNKVDPPAVPSFFRYNSEAVVAFDMIFPVGDNLTENVQFSAVLNHEQYYDWDAKVVMTKYVPWILGEQNRYEYTSNLIQDFQQGLSYDILPRLGQCFVHRIENFTSAGDVTVGPDGSVTLTPPWIFADLDEPMQYNGVHEVRGVEADTWVGLKRHEFTHLEETYVWYYASPLTLDESETFRGDARAGEVRDQPDFPETISNDKSPMRFEKYLSVLANYPHLTYNIYNYQDNPPMTHVLDISPCYDPTQMRSFVVDLPSDSLSRVHHLRDDLVYAAQQAMAEVAVVSPLRVNRPVLEESGDTLRLLFTVLDKSDVAGDSPGAAMESTMDEAAALISQNVDQSKLHIIVHIKTLAHGNHEPTFVVVLPVPGSMREVQRDDGNEYQYETMDKYQSGDMAGLAVGMLILGALLGVVAQMAWQRRASGISTLPRVSLARKAPTPETTISLNADLTGSEI